MRKTVLFSILVLCFAACKKDKYQTTPQLKFESVNTKILAPGNIIQFDLSFTDAEGDLPGVLYVEKFDPVCAASNFNDEYILPNFPSGKNQQGNVTVTYGYNVDNFPPIQAPICSRNDTCVFKFVLKDKAQNVSDTVVSPTIVIIK